MSTREVEYVSVNVLEDAAGLERLSRAGLKSLPVVSRADEFVFGVDLSAVAQLLGLSYDDAPKLSANALIERYQRVLEAAIGFARQIPSEHLGDKLPHRDRSYLTLANHLVQIAVDYIEVTQGADLTGRLAASLPEVNLAVAGLSHKANAASRLLGEWLQRSSETELQRTVLTYFGDQTLHQVLERCVWHSAQHARQLMMVLDGLGLKTIDPLTQEDFSALPMPEGVWDG